MKEAKGSSLNRQARSSLFWTLLCVAMLCVAIHPAYAKTYKVLHIMSYDLSWVWNQDQFNGFKKMLEGVDVEYKVFEMDTKRHSSPEWLAKISQEAKTLIDSWHPDLVYTNDDNAQEYVAKEYVNTEIPFVFSAVNAAPESYGFAGSSNVTGILEQEHFVPTVKLLQKIVPEVKKIAIIVDDGPMWIPIVKRMQAKQTQLPGVEFVSWNVIKTFEEFKQQMSGFQTTVDAVGLIGIFRFKDAQGENVPYQEVLRWTAEHSHLPDFTFWKDRISYGTLCTVTVSGYEQGLAAGEMARSILFQSESPGNLPIHPTVKGEPVVSLARAKTLGIKLRSDVLLASEVIKDFKWNQ